jgi:hypothetical protein
MRTKHKPTGREENATVHQEHGQCFLQHFFNLQLAFYNHINKAEVGFGIFYYLK